MKKTPTSKSAITFLFAAFLFFISGVLNAQNISINTSGAANSTLSMLEVLQISTTANTKGLHVAHSGAIVGTGYGMWVEKTGASTTNIAGYFNVSGGTNNYAGIFMGGDVGIGTTTPGVQLDVQQSSNSGFITSYPVIRAYNNLVTIGDGTTTFNQASLRMEAGNGSVQGSLLATYQTAGNFPTGLYVRTATNHPIFFTTNNTNVRMTVAAGGNVGIGTTAPGVLLDLKGNNTGFGGQLRLSATDYDQISFYNSGALMLNAANRLGDIYYDVANSQLHIENHAGSKYVTLNQSGGNVGIATTSPSYSLDVNGSAGFTGIHKIGPAVNNPEHGMWNPIWTSVAAGLALYSDEEFASGANSVSVYNNSGGGGVVHTWENGDGSQPNTTGKWIRIDNNGAATSPGYGGFVQPFTSRRNATFVQRFRAKLPIGYTLNIAENAQGTNNTSYWLTPTAGTGKWEDYVRISHCGNTGTFSSSGYVYVSGTVATFTWYLASCNAFEVGASSLGASNNNFIKNQVAADQVAGFRINGNGLFNGGSVGVGTITPSRRLTIQNPTTTSANNQLLYLKQQPNDYGYSFNIDDVTTGRMYIQGVNLGVETNIITMDRVSRNVGIAISNPIARLDVQGPTARTGTTGTSPSFYVSGTLSTGQTGPASGNIEFRHDNGTQGIGFGYNTIYQTGSNANQDLNLLSRGSSPITLNAYAYSTGNVGIGITNPLAKLHINASAGIRLDSPADDAFPAITAATRTTGGEIRAQSGLNSDYGTLILSAGGETGINQKMSLVLKGYGGTDNTQARFLYGNNPVMTIKGFSGDVGIGTINPGFRLTVRVPASTTPGDSMYGAEITSGTRWMRLYPGTLGAQSWNNIVKNFDNAIIYNAGGAFTIAPWEGGPSGLRIEGASGLVGIGMSYLSAYTYKLQVNGTTACSGNVWSSDSRMKKNIQEFKLSGLDIVNKLHPVTYEWKEVMDDGMKGTQMGFIAQEIEKLLPTMVLTTKDSLQSKGVKYNELLPILVKAIQEQQSIIDNHKSEFAKQQDLIAALEMKIAELSGILQGEITTVKNK